MNRSIKRIAVVLVMLCTVICIILASALYKSPTVSAEVSDTGLKTQYLCGQTIEISRGKITVAGESYDATGRYVILPDGRAVEASNITLDQAGQYQVVYFTNLGNQYVEARTSFMVKSNLYSVSSASSACVYGKPDNYENEGVIVKLKDGDTFNYNQVIDLNDIEKAQAILSFYAIPENFGVADCKDVIIRLTDAYDETNFIELKISNNSHMGSWADVAVYCKGAANGQIFTGINRDVYRQDWCGQISYFTLTGKLSHVIHTTLDENTFNFYMDYEKRQLWTDATIESDGLIIDLDDINAFNKLWNGFSTGECFLSVRGESYQALSLNIVLTDIVGNKIYDNELDVNNNIYIDVNLGEYNEENLPEAKLGMPYKLYDFTTISTYQTNLKNSVNVYYNYGSNNVVNVQIKDGYFIPNKVGCYTIKYSAKDNYGNVEEKMLDIYADNANPLTFSCEQKMTSCSVMESCTIIENVSFADFSGNVTIEGVASIDGIVTYALDEKYAFVPEYEGEYKINIKCSDYIQTVEKDFVLMVNKSDVSIIKGDAIIPNNLIKGATYILQNISSYNYSNGKPIEIDTEIYVKEDNLPEQKLQDNLYKVNAEEKVIITYKTADGKDCKSYERKIVDVGYADGSIDVRKYFMPSSEDVTLDYKDNYLSFNFNEDSYVDFVNLVMTKESRFIVKTSKSGCNFDTVNVFLEDCFNGKTVKFTYYSLGGKIYFKINDNQEERILSGNFKETNGFEILLEYDNQTKKATADKLNFVEVKKYLDGSEFNGFTQDKAYLRIEVENVTAPSYIYINNINGHVLVENNNNKDEVEPQFSVKTLTAQRTPGEKFVLDGALFYDVLDPYTECKLEIYTMGADLMKNYYVNEEGIIFNGQQDSSLDYNLCFKEIGEYIVKYVVKDGSVNKNDINYTYVISVIDNIAPEIMILSPNTTAKVNKTYSVAGYRLSDNVSAAEDLEIHIYALRPDGEMLEVENGQIKLTQKGMYKIFYFVFDEMKNQTIVSYVVNVN